MNERDAYIETRPILKMMERGEITQEEALKALSETYSKFGMKVNVQKTSVARVTGLNNTIKPDGAVNID